MQEEHNIQCHIECEQTESLLDTDLRVVLFQAVRELLVNITKHARATKVDISIERTPEMIIIVVKDNGIGFDPSPRVPSEPEGGGFGLFSIRERMAQLGGQMVVESATGEGSTVTLKAQLD